MCAILCPWIICQYMEKLHYLTKWGNIVKLVYWFAFTNRFNFVDQVAGS